ncbi:MAG TPA: hypothetical protein VKY57_01405 [Chitinispirillaceae bacterium]|nr:hypothetical protein [Chitinispirillaceae bacterium]
MSKVTEEAIEIFVGYENWELYIAKNYKNWFKFIGSCLRQFIADIQKKCRFLY